MYILLWVSDVMILFLTLPALAAAAAAGIPKSSSTPDCPKGWYNAHEGLPNDIQCERCSSICDKRIIVDWNCRKFCPDEYRQMQHEKQKRQHVTTPPLKPMHLSSNSYQPINSISVTTSIPANTKDITNFSNPIINIMGCVLLVIIILVIIIVACLFINRRRRSRRKTTKIEDQQQEKGAKDENHEEHRLMTFLSHQELQPCESQPETSVPGPVLDIPQSSISHVR